MSSGVGTASSAATGVRVARTGTERMPRACIVHRFVHHYRVPFYEGLADELAARGIALTLVQGRATDDEARRADDVAMPWAVQIPFRTIGPKRRPLYWQAGLAPVRGASLVIVAQETRLLLNYVLLARQALGHEPVAFWGHGVNYQTSSASSAAEAVKRRLSTRVHWWFAYTAEVALIVRSMGYPPERITDVRNSIDTRAVRAQLADVTPDETRGLLDDAGLAGTNLAVYSGGLYSHKRIDLLLAAAEQVRAAVPDFELVVIGGGPLDGAVRDAAARHPWIHAAGPQFGRDAVRWFGPARLLLMPGLVGLVVLDAFATATPMVTIADSEHSPEFSYLSDGVNSVVLPAGSDAQAYAAEVARLLHDPDTVERLADGCRVAQGDYSIEEMVTRFADGIEQAMGAPRRARSGR